MLKGCGDVFRGDRGLGDTGVWQRAAGKSPEAEAGVWRPLDLWSQVGPFSSSERHLSSLLYELAVAQLQGTKWTLWWHVLTWETVVIHCT